MTVRYESDTEPAPADEPAATTDTEAQPGPREAIGRYAELGGFTLNADTHPWYAAGDAIGSPEDARAASTVLAELRSRDVPAVRAAVTELVAPGGLGEPDSVIALGLVVDILRRVQGTSAKLRPEAYAADLAALTAATAGSRWRKEQGVKLSWGRRRALRAEARQLAAGGRTRRADLHEALAAAAAERADWTALAGAAPAAGKVRPVVPADATRCTEAAQAVEALTDAVRALGRLLPGRDLEKAPLGELADLIDRLAADEGTLYRLPTLRALRAELDEAGLADLLEELAERQADREAAIAAYDRRSDAADTADGGVEAARQVLAAGPRTEVDPGAELTPAAPEAPVAELVEIPAARPETVIEAEAVEAAPETQAEPVPVPVPVAAAEVEAVAEARTETERIEVVAEEAAETEAVVEVAAAAEPAEAATEPGTETEGAAEAVAPEPEPEPVAEVEGECGAEAVAEAGTESETEPVAEVEVEAEHRPEAVVEPEAEPAVEAEAMVEPEATSEPVAEAKAAPTPEPAPEPSAVSASAPVAEAGEPVTEAAAKPEPAPESDRPKRVRRPRKPSLTAGQPITAYSSTELRSLVRWIDSDGVERTDDDLLRAAMKELGFTRLGPRIKEALGAAVAEVRG
ncbi:hypothetical protein GCM10010430_32340 [Kitasatospora cystarginea]|uniref:Uncharacterized protein n=1 Tax=Kitasatospora cystarginea TaxID=58350 RepID=A0ABN3E330_9ACTN